MRIFNHSIWLNLLCTICFIGACSDDPTSPPTILDMTHDQPADLDQDMVEDIGEDMVDMSAVPCSETLTWRQGTPIQGARDHHTSFITQGKDSAYLHVLGGTNYQSIYKDHRYAQIQDDGSLGQWQEAAQLPTHISGNSVIQHNQTVYLLGGRGLQSMTNQVWHAKVSEDGTLSQWTTVESMPNPRFHNSAALYDGRLYISGGIQPDGVAQNNLYDTTIEPDGSLGAWRTRALTVPRSHHASFAHKGYLYLAMGFHGNPFQNATTDYQGIIRAKLSQDDLQWEVYASSPHGLSTHASTKVGDCLYIFGGLWQQNGTYTYSNEVLLYDLNMAPSNNQSPKQLTGHTTGRSHMHHVPFYNGHFYIIGGSKAFQDVVTTVEIGKLSP